MQVLHITPYYAPAYAFGGVVRAAEGLARALARRGHSVSVLTTDALTPQTRLPIEQEEWRDGVRVLRARNLLLPLRARANLSSPDPRRLRALAQSAIASADVLHLHEFRTVENLLLAGVGARAGKPLVLSPHGTLALHTGRGRLKRLWDTLLSARTAAYIAHVLCLTAQEQADAQALFGGFGLPALPGFSVVPNGIDPAEVANLREREPMRAAFRTQYGLGDAAVCLFMARLHPRKGLLPLVQAFRAADLPNTRLVIAGPDEGALANVTPLLNARMTVTGYLDGAARLAAFAAADLLALPAVGEGLPLVVLEAMGAGLPVLISPECYLPEVGQAGAGLIVPPQPDALAEALRALLPDATRRAAMGAAAQALVRQRYTWDAIAAQVEAVYAGLLPG